MTVKERLQRRKDAVSAVINGEEISTVARVMGIPLRTMFSWLARYRNGGWDALEDGHRRGRPQKVTGSIMQWLYNAVTMGNPRQYQLPFHLWTLPQIQALMKKFKNISLSKSSVSRLFHHLGLTPQRPLFRSYRKNPKEIEKYLKKTFPHLRKEARRMGAEIYFVDESSIRSDNHRGRTWGPKGETPEVWDTGDRFSLKLISAVSPRGDMRFQAFKGRMNSTKFLEFVEKLRKDAGKPVIIVCDGAAYHTSGKVRKFVQERGDITLEHLPAYAPELNPDEQVWNHLKGRLKKILVFPWMIWREKSAPSCDPFKGQRV